MIDKELNIDSLVSAIELSKLFGISTRTVQRLAQEDVLPKPKGKRGNANLYRLDEAVQAYCWHLIDKAMK